MANMKTLTVNGVTYTIDDPDAVSYGTPQALTDAQKQQARENIGAVSAEQVDKAVSGLTGKELNMNGYGIVNAEYYGVEKDHMGFFLESGGYIDVEGNIETGTRRQIALFTGYGRNSGINQPVILRGVYPGLEETDAVNKGQLESTINAAVKDMIDKTCPAFAESGEIVTCEPVEGYPLTVTAGEETARITRCGKNLLPYPYPNTTKTVNGITFTDNGDGTITANGTATADASFLLLNRNLGIPFSEDMGVGFSGTPKGGSTSTYHMINPYNGVYDTGSGAYIPGNTTTSAHKQYWCSYLQIVIKTGYTAENLVFEPCLYVGNNRGYEPYKTPETFAPGDTIPALTGVNTVYADAGEVTVTGRANPAAIIEKLTKAVIS